MKRQEATSPANITPFTCHLPSSLHSAMKMRSGLKGVSMVDIVIEGVRLALESEKFRMTEDEKRILLGA